MLVAVWAMVPLPALGRPTLGQGSGGAGVGVGDEQGETLPQGERAGVGNCRAIDHGVTAGTGAAAALGDGDLPASGATPDVAIDRVHVRLPAAIHWKSS